MAPGSPDRHPLPEARRALLARLRKIVGRRHLLTRDAATRPYRTGYRFGCGPVLAVVRPGSLVEQWRIVQACAAAGVIMLFQAANTGLTGGSTPDGSDYDRDIVLINTMRLTGAYLLDDGRQVVCLPGLSLDRLERLLAPLGREPHSVIGSSCIGASVVGGICNNSGGSLVRRGPAYTELALFARIDHEGHAELVNHLGIDLGFDPEEMLSRLDQGRFDRASTAHDQGRCASDHGYEERVRDIDAPSPARFNADKGQLFEAAGSAGRLAVFAVRLDTFAKSGRTFTFYIGTNEPGELTKLRRDMLRMAPLPIAAEYMDRTSFDIAERYGKDIFLAIRWLGTHRLRHLFGLKARLDAVSMWLGGAKQYWSDRLLQFIADRMGPHLPKRMHVYRDRFQHHLLLKVSEDGLSATREMLAALFPSGTGEFFECTPDEADKAFLHRFAVAGAAIRYRAVHGRHVEDIVALDIALPRNTQNWTEHLPDNLEECLLHKMYYGHFFCHVFHQDYILGAGHSARIFEHELCQLLDERGARYPAEHNVGHLYPAGPDQLAFFRSLDPCNQMNPGIGQTSRKANWQ